MSDPVSDDDEPVPKFGRGKMQLRLPMRHLISIMALVICLIAVVGLRRGCADGVANMYRSFDLDAGPADARPPRRR